MSQEDDDATLQKNLSQQVRRLRTPRRRGALGLLITGGTAGLLLTLPLVGGAYLGRWLDEQSAGYSFRWTINFILLGLVLGIYNVYLFFKEHR